MSPKMKEDEKSSKKQKSNSNGLFKTATMVSLILKMSYVM